MKKVNQLQFVPASLLDFLKEYPHDQRQIKDWKAFNNEGGPVKHELMQALDDIQHGLCAYCEIKLVLLTDKGLIYDRQIEHFHPKSDIPNTIDWMFEITNLFAACRGGSQIHLFGEDSYARDDDRCLEPNVILFPLNLLQLWQANHKFSRTVFPPSDSGIICSISKGMPVIISALRQ